MGIFTVTAREDSSSQLEAVIKAKFPNDYYQIMPHQWFISTEGTAIKLAETLGVLEETGPGSALVLTISSYHGRWTTDLWDWLKAKWEQSSG